jgi:hypothetical protein
VAILKTESFDIFSGAVDENPVWLETVETLSGARQRMEEIATEMPGKYFLFSPLNQSILAQVWTFKRPLHTFKITTVARSTASPQG